MSKNTTQQRQQARVRGLTSQGVMDKNKSALVIIKIVTKLVSPYIVLSQEYYSRIFDPRKEVAPIIKKKKKKKRVELQRHDGRSYGLTVD